MFCRNCGNEMHPEAVFCVKCGVPVGKGNHFCPTCGAPTHEEAAFCTTCGVALQTNAKQKPATNIAPRGLALAIVLSIVTCGFYAIYWFVKLTDELNELADTKDEPSGVVCFLLNLVTCGIYGIYWSYMMGKKQEMMEEKGGSTTAILYLVLAIVGFGIINYALIQDAINKRVGEE